MLTLTGLSGGGSIGAISLRISPGGVENSHLGENVVESPNILDEPGIEFSEIDGIANNIFINNIGTEWQNVETLTMNLPAAGYVNCIASVILDSDEGVNTSTFS